MRQRGWRFSYKRMSKVFLKTDSYLLQSLCSSFIKTLTTREISDMLVELDGEDMLEVCENLSNYDDAFSVVHGSLKPELLRKRLFDIFEVREHLRTKERLIECVSNLFP